MIHAACGCTTVPTFMCSTCCQTGYVAPFPMPELTRDDSSASAYSCHVPFHLPADTTRCLSLNLPDMLFTIVPTPARRTRRSLSRRPLCHAVHVAASASTSARLAGLSAKACSSHIKPPNDIPMALWSIATAVLSDVSTELLAPCISANSIHGRQQ